MSNTLQSLANQVLSESGVIIAVAWLVAEASHIDDVTFAVFALIYAAAAATKSGKPAIGWAFVSAIFLLSVTVKSGLIP